MPAGRGKDAQSHGNQKGCSNRVVHFTLAETGSATGWMDACCRRWAPPSKVPTSESPVKEVLAWDAASRLGGHMSSEFSQGQGHPRLGEGTADAHPGDDLASGKKPDETYSWVDGDKHQGR